MNQEFYKKLVDLYAGRELPSDLEDQMEFAAFGDSELSHDMTTLRRTVDTLRADSGPEFSEESYQRVLMKLYARGANIEPKAAAPVHLQYHLPMQG
ncbi:hypothetical protein [Fimbriimonas ginsengisoli]|uniref:Uncharacterized protein n=1 Tax=Fimbriimonas ginsengisoli Gsoil 348 TaxID=661478 RepID=A0A068NYB5_FIMGI|nr:hypothetical protein [Fimbriimonas ginsengisoli]AIE87990.1 hypothetical protein OP10G_4622 [Fimbriimonas ginsengisoli Gsoil 348]